MTGSGRDTEAADHMASSHEQIGRKARNFGVEAHSQWPTFSKETLPPKVSTTFQNSMGGISHSDYNTGSFWWHVAHRFLYGHGLSLTS